MFRLWCKLFDESGHLLKDTVIANDNPDLNRTRKIFDGIHDACYEFDLSEPIWLELSVIPKYVLIMIILLIRLIFPIWKLK